jgi:endonuclease YncB( thermonuclease family)
MKVAAYLHADMISKALAAVLLCLAAAPAAARLSDVKNVQVIVDKPALTDADEVAAEVIELAQKELRGITVTTQLAEVKLHVRLDEVRAAGGKEVAYRHAVAFTGQGTDKIGTFEKTYWSRREAGVVPAGKYGKEWRRNLKRMLKEFEDSAGSAESFSGRVTAVSDGDTLVVLEQGDVENFRTVRLHNVDCPEKTQPYGEESRAFTAGLAQGKTVTVKIATVDRYNRVLGEVVLPDGKNLARELLKAGMAWWYNKYSDDPALAALEAEAEEKKRGLWQDPDPTPPWDYRKESDNMPFKSKPKKPAGKEKSVTLE